MQLRLEERGFNKLPTGLGDGTIWPVRLQLALHLFCKTLIETRSSYASRSGFAFGPTFWTFANIALWWEYIVPSMDVIIYVSRNAHAATRVAVCRV